MSGTKLLRKGIGSALISYFFISNLFKAINEELTVTKKHMLIFASYSLILMVTLITFWLALMMMLGIWLLNLTGTWLAAISLTAGVNLIIIISVLLSLIKVTRKLNLAHLGRNVLAKSYTGLLHKN